MLNAIILGATSTIAEAVIEQLASHGYNLYLFARSETQLERIKQHLQVKYPQIKVYCENYAAEVDRSEGLTDKLEQAYKSLEGKVDLALIAHGNLPDQIACEQSWLAAQSALQVNGISVLEACHAIALKLKEQRSGTLAVISSVAGERGRQSNYIYGTAKGMLNIYLQGLRNSLYQHNVHILTIMPGFVDTRMTKEFKKGLLWVSPEKVANDIYQAIVKKKDIIFTPWFWKYIMKIICLLPEGIFKKMKL